MTATSAVTTPTGAPTPTLADVQRARAAAQLAAAQAGVSISLAHGVGELDAARAMIDDVWRPQPDNPPVTSGMLRALTHAGSYCGVALDDGRVVGASVGFLGLEQPDSPGPGSQRPDLASGTLVHSHITGTLPETAGRHVGRALKLDQRAWALERGIITITWTYDPLVRRNAYFNITKLGARVTTYLDDFYGDMTDSLNVGQGSDRLVATWRLLDPTVTAAADGIVATTDLGDLAELAQHNVRLVVDDEDDSPVVFAPAGPVPGPGPALIRVPGDIEKLRTRSPDLASAWREAVRSTLGSHLRAGWKITAFTRAGYYVLTPPTALPEGTR